MVIISSNKVLAQIQMWDTVIRSVCSIPPHRKLDSLFRPKYASKVQRHNIAVLRLTCLRAVSILLLLPHNLGTQTIRAFPNASPLQRWSTSPYRTTGRIKSCSEVEDKFTTTSPSTQLCASYVRIGVHTSPTRRRTNRITSLLVHKSYRNGDVHWEGDDIRWISKIQRNIRRSTYDWQSQPLRNTLIASSLLVFIYQCMDTIYSIRNQYPEAWSSYFVTILFDTIMGNSRPGPFTLQFVHSNMATMPQPYRYVTSGFLHGGIIHLLLNMNALRQLPSWLETGLGPLLYITTFLLAIVGGNIMQTTTIIDHTSLCLGSSGGICGLYGLMYICLVRMGNNSAAWRVVRGVGLLFLYGTFLNSISNAAHIGGFITGVTIALLSGPNYRASYGLRRKNSLQVDPYDRPYRTVMGFDKIPSSRGILPLETLWIVIAVAIFLRFNVKATVFR
jgi:membrane associated rhomboid family serine protease